MDLSVFRKINQVAVVVRDRDATVRKYRELMGIEPFVVCSTPQLPGRIFRGEETDFEVKAAVYHLDNGMDLEVLEPSKGSSLWREFLDRHGEGLHHVMYDVDDYDGFVEYMKERGIEIIQEGPSAQPGKKWAYLDSYDQLGYYIEIKTK